MEKGRIPALPEGTDWSPETVDWFEAWRDSAITKDWDMRQWHYVYDTAVVHSAVHYGDMTMLPELHRRLQYMGLDFPNRKTETVQTPIKETSLNVIRGKRDKKARKAIS